MNGRGEDKTEAVLRANKYHVHDKAHCGFASSQQPTRSRLIRRSSRAIEPMLMCLALHSTLFSPGVLFFCLQWVHVEQVGLSPGYSRKTCRWTPVTALPGRGQQPILPAPLLASRIDKSVRTGVVSGFRAAEAKPTLSMLRSFPHALRSCSRILALVACYPVCIYMFFHPLRFCRSLPFFASRFQFIFIVVFVQSPG